MKAEALLVYDGSCGFCTRSAAWVATKWPSPGPSAVPWQRLGTTGLARLGLTERDVTRAAWWVADDRRLEGHLAVASSLVAAGGLCGLVGRLLSVPPVRWLAAAGYRIVAANRSRLPGGSNACGT